MMTTLEKAMDAARHLPENAQTELALDIMEPSKSELHVTSGGRSGAGGGDDDDDDDDVGKKRPVR